MTWKEDFSSEFVYQFNAARSREGKHHVMDFDGEAKFITSVPKLESLTYMRTDVEFSYDGDQAGYSEATKLLVTDEFGHGHTIKYDMPLHEFMDKVSEKKLHPLRTSTVKVKN